MVWEGLMLILSYAYLGYGIKYIDEAYDENKYSKKIAIVFVITCSVLMGGLCAIDPYSMAIFFAIIIGVGVSDKLDNLAFKLSVMVVAGMIVIVKDLFFYDYFVEFAYFVFFVLLIMCVLDEEADKYGHRNKIKILNTRPFMKIAIVLLWAAKSVAFVYVLAFFAFDIFYMLAEYKPPKERHFDLTKGKWTK